jgi:hypothetical protein
MIKQPRSLGSKSVILFVLVVSIIPVIFTTQQSQQAQASNNCAEKSLPAEIICGAADAVTGYNNGYNDGKRAGLNGDSNQCPESDSTSGYCIGWGAGYDRGERSREDVEGNQNSDDGEFQNDNNNDDDDN